MNYPSSRKMEWALHLKCSKDSLKICTSFLLLHRNGTSFTLSREKKLGQVMKIQNRVILGYSRFWYSCFQHALPQKWMISSVKLYKTFHIIYNFYLWFWFYIFIFPYFPYFLLSDCFWLRPGVLGEVLQVTTDHSKPRRFSFWSLLVNCAIDKYFRHLHNYKNTQSISEDRKRN